MGRNLFYEIYFEFGSIPVLMGGVLDPEVAQIQVVDDKNRKMDLKIVTLADKRFWFAAEPHPQEQAAWWFQVEALDQSGNKIGEGMVIYPD